MQRNRFPATDYILLKDERGCHEHQDRRGTIRLKNGCEVEEADSIPLYPSITMITSNQHAFMVYLNTPKISCQAHVMQIFL